MNTFNMRIGNLEVRNETKIGSDEKYLEIIKWIKPEQCITIAIFYKDKEGYYLQSIGDRIVMERCDWANFGDLVRNGFEFLKKDANRVEGEQ